MRQNFPFTIEGAGVIIAVVSLRTSPVRMEGNPAFFEKLDDYSRKYQLPQA